jgi:ribosomal protein S18 acetylase RimI-like enzyme
MYEILAESLSPFLRVNLDSEEKNHLIIDKGVVMDYISNPAYLCRIVEINSHIAGWIAGSSDPGVLSEHGCSGEEFYIEEIVVDSDFRGKGVGRNLINIIVTLILRKTMVVDTLLTNTGAINFYLRMGFNKVMEISPDFSKNWIRLSREIS